MAGEVHLNVQTNRATMLTDAGDQLAHVLIEVASTSQVANVQMPLNLGLVLDHSGPMSGAELAKQAEVTYVALISSQQVGKDGVLRADSPPASPPIPQFIEMIQLTEGGR